MEEQHIDNMPLERDAIYEGKCIVFVSNIMKATGDKIKSSEKIYTSIVIS